jgi:cytochrome c
MSNLVKIALACALLVLAGQSTGADGKSLVIKYGCIGCHKVEGKMVGPAYSDVAARYRGQADAREHLAASILNGGVDRWGKIPMPPKGGRKAIPDEDVDQLVSWILEL